MECMPRYNEYSDLFEKYTAKDLKEAFDLIHSTSLQKQAFHENNSLLAFVVDSELQEKLFLYFEDLGLKKHNQENS